MARGTIIRIDRALGEGMIRPDDGTPDLGFYLASVAWWLVGRLHEGQRVAFDYRHDPVRPGRIRARNIRLLTEAPPHAPGESHDDQAPAPHL
jgi:cold shock CspA family protein